MPVTATHLTTNGDGTDGTSWNTASVSPAANKLLLLAVTVHRSGALPSDAVTVTGCNLTWVKIATNTSTLSGSASRVTLFRAMGAAPSSGALTITAGESCVRALWSLTEFDNVDTTGTNGSGAIVQSATNRDAGGSLAGLTVTLAAFGSVDNATFGCIGGSDMAAFTPGSGFTELGEIAIDTYGHAQSEWKNSNDTSVDWSWTSGDTSAAGVAVEIKYALAGQTYTRNCNETLILIQTFNKTTARSFALTLILVQTFNKSLSRSLIETLILIQTFTRGWGRSFTETLILVESFSRSIGKALTETLILVQTFNKLITRTLNETLILIETFTKSISKTLNETLILIETFTKATTYVRSFTETLVLVQTFSKDIGKRLNETLIISDTLGKLFDKIWMIGSILKLSKDINKPEGAITSKDKPEGIIRDKDKPTRV